MFNGSLNFSCTSKLLRAALLGTIALGVTACAEKATQSVQYAQHDYGGNEPTVISSRPGHDKGVLAESDRQLDGADWKVLQKKGPQPVWDPEGKRLQGQDEKGNIMGLKGSIRTPVVASTQPSQFLAGVAEDDLPVKIVELPDGKLRVIWVLRSYGGTSVASTRDPSTARRNVTVTAPDLAPLTAIITQQLGGAGTVAAMPAANTLVITCDKAAKANVLDLLARLDISPRQVEITAKIFEVRHDFDFQQGAQLLAKHIGGTGTQTGSSHFDTQRFMNTAAGQPFQGSVLTLMQASKDAGLSLEASFQLLAEAGLITIVSSPRMTVAIGQTGYLLAGQELPIQTANIINNNLQTSTTYKPVGVQLYITPEAVGRDKVKLHTISIVSSVAGFTPLPDMTGNGNPQGLMNPIIDSREAETAVTVEDGNTLVISGLRMIKTLTRENKVPGLGDIPVLGWFFKSQRSQQQMTDLYFFVTPTLLEDAAERYVRMEQVAPSAPAAQVAPPAPLPPLAPPVAAAPAAQPVPVPAPAAVAPAPPATQAPPPAPVPAPAVAQAPAPAPVPPAVPAPAVVQAPAPAPVPPAAPAPAVVQAPPPAAAPAPVPASVVVQAPPPAPAAVPPAPPVVQAAPAPAPAPAPVPQVVKAAPPAPVPAAAPVAAPAATTPPTAPAPEAAPAVAKAP